MTSFIALAPVLFLVIGSLAVLLVEAFSRKRDTAVAGTLSLASLAGAGFFFIAAWERQPVFFGGSLTLDRAGAVLGLAIAASGILFVLMSLRYAVRQDMNEGEYYALLLFALAGMLIMVTTPSLLVAFLGLEILSVSSYALAGFKRNDGKSNEAAVKYFLTGSFAGAFLVFGLALVFGAAGSLDFAVIAERTVHGHGGIMVAGWAGLALVAAGLGFKVAVVPFHMWAPDVYEGAPTPATAFFSVGPKLAGFAVLLRLFAPVWKVDGPSQVVFRLIWAVAALTIIVGNLAALRQKNLKRLLAYSSIAHSGYLLIAVLTADGAGLVFYLLSYLFMNAGAFAVLAAMTRKGEEFVEIDDFAGMAARHPWLAGSLAVFLFSLAGFPPTGGFLAKFYVFGEAVRQGHAALVVIAVLGSLVSVYYYLKIVVVMYMTEPARPVEIEERGAALSLVLLVCLSGVLFLGLWPGPVLGLIRQAAAVLF